MNGRERKETVKEQNKIFHVSNVFMTSFSVMLCGICWCEGREAIPKIPNYQLSKILHSRLIEVYERSNEIEWFILQLFDSKKKNKIEFYYRRTMIDCWSVSVYRLCRALLVFTHLVPYQIEEPVISAELNNECNCYSKSILCRDACVLPFRMVPHRS